MSTRTKGAIVVGIVLVIATYLLTEQQPTSPEPASATGLIPPTIATDPGLREYIPPTDSDGDGVPDWQELLDNTEPLAVPDNVQSFREPETLTDQFALDFFQTYMRNSSFGDFGQSPDELVAQASDELVAQAQDTLRTRDDITIIGSSPEQLRTHANQVARVLNQARLPEGTRNELEIVEDAVARGDANILRELDPISRNYSLIITELELMPVPVVMVKEHLDFLNTLVAVRNDIAAMRYLFSDPMFALLRLRRYPDDLRGLATAYDTFFSSAREQGAVFETGDPVYTVYEFAQ